VKLENIIHTLRGVTPSAKKVFCILVKAQLQKQVHKRSGWCDRCPSLIHNARSSFRVLSPHAVVSLFMPTHTLSLYSHTALSLRAPTYSSLLLHLESFAGVLQNELLALCKKEFIHSNEVWCSLCRSCLCLWIGVWCVDVRVVCQVCVCV
jgi:hypothetical protein